MSTEKKLTHPLSCILPSFSQNASLLILTKGLSKCASTISFRKYKWKLVLLVIYLFQYSSTKSNFFMLNMTFDVVLSTVFVKYWNSLLLAMQSLEEHPSFCSACVYLICTYFKNLIVFHHGGNTFLVYFDICIKFT